MLTPFEVQNLYKDWTCIGKYPWLNGKEGSTETVVTSAGSLPTLLTAQHAADSRGDAE